MSRNTIDETPNVRNTMLECLAKQLVSWQNRYNEVVVKLAKAEGRPGTAITVKVEDADVILDQIKQDSLGGEGTTLTAEDQKELVAAANFRIEKEFQATNEIEVNENATISEGENGRWISAWIWIPSPGGDQ